MDSRSFSCIQHAELHAGSVCRFSHFAAQRVDLADKMALCGPADRGIAGHHGNGIELDAHSERPHAKTRAGKRRFAPGMAKADHDDIIFAGKIGLHKFPLRIN